MALAAPCYAISEFPNLAVRTVALEHNVELSPHMKTIQIVLDIKLLQSTDEAARRTNRNRSEFVREALRRYLQSLEICTLEERDRSGYSRQPQTSDESRIWEVEASRLLRNQAPSLQS